MHETNVTDKLSDPPEVSLQPIDASHCHSPTCSSDLLTLTRDINNPHKTMGYLAHDSTDFYFVGPDRLPQSIDTVDQFVAKIIQTTGLPNYKMARIPVSSFNIQALEHYLSDYPGKRAIQYLKFGFPLSLSDAHNLHNTDISNHALAVQYPKAVEEYLNKEIA